MAIKRKKIKGKYYYYLDRNIRVGENKWKTFSVYAGSKKPSKEKILKLEKKLQKKIKDYIANQIVKPQTKFINEKTALLLERIKTSHRKLLNLLDKKSREDYLKRQRQTFITNTNAIEGSRLTLEQTKRILELKDKYDIEEVDELEVINMEECLGLYDQILRKKTDLDEKLILRLHLVLLKTIPNYEGYAGVWRAVNVHIRGSKYDFPDWKEVPKLMTDLLKWYKEKKDSIHPVELAAIFHTRLVTIHPFADGNGRMARLLMNHILQVNGFPFTDIPFSKRDEYFETQERGHFGKYELFVLFLVKEIRRQFNEFKKTKVTL
jgi:Fic family protein